MKSYFLVPFILLLLFNTNLFSQKNYKGPPKYQQPNIEILPKNTQYILGQKINATLESKLNAKIDELFTKHTIAGITATILIPDEGYWEINRGFISKPENIKIDSTSVFYWASVGKLITSTIIHQLVAEHKLSFDDKLSTWFPDFQHAKKITIQQLLTHTNGLYSFNADSTVHFSNKSYSTTELLAVARAKKNLFKPGEYWSYTNTGYLLLALIIEQTESKNFSEIVKNRISEPLHLKTLQTATENKPNLALAHKKDSVIRKDSYGPLGAGNIVSNSKDMAIFLSGLLTGKIIPVEAVHAMMADLYPMFGSNQYYGKGIMIYDLSQTKNSWIGHSGGTENYKAIVAYNVKSKAIITISINENIPVEAVANKLFELISE